MLCYLGHKKMERGSHGWLDSHLRQSATCVNIYMMQQPEAYIGGIADSVDSNGISAKRTQDYLQKIADAFVDWVWRF